MGWHFSYAMDTTRMMEKLTRFSHSDDAHVRRFVNGTSAQVRRWIEEKVSACSHFFTSSGLAYRHTPYDGQLPTLKGWPRHPLAPTVGFLIDQLYSICTLPDQQSACCGESVHSVWRCGRRYLGNINLGNKCGILYR